MCYKQIAAIQYNRDWTEIECYVAVRKILNLALEFRRWHPAYLTAKYLRDTPFCVCQAYEQHQHAAAQLQRICTGLSPVSFSRLCPICNRQFACNNNNCLQLAALNAQRGLLVFEVWMVLVCEVSLCVQLPQHAHRVLSCKHILALEGMEG